MTRAMLADSYGWRDAVFMIGQSEVGPSGSPIEDWSELDRGDLNLACNIFVADGDWTTVNAVTHSRNGMTGQPTQFALTGTAGLSLNTAMRNRGLNPAIFTYYINGADSSQMLDAAPVFCAYAAAQLSRLRRVRSVWAWYDQGQAEALSTDPIWTSWGANTAAIWAALRAALGIPDLHIALIQLPEVTTPPRVPGGWPFRPEMRQAQADLVASDPNSSIHCVQFATTVDTVHYTKDVHDRECQLVLPAIY